MRPNATPLRDADSLLALVASTALVRCIDPRCLHTECRFGDEVLAPHYEINHAGRPPAVICQLCYKAYWPGYVGQGWRLGHFHGKNEGEKWTSE